VGAALGLSVLGADDGTVLGDVLEMTVGLKESCKDGAALGNVERTMVGETLGVSVVVLSGSSGKASALSPTVSPSLSFVSLGSDELKSALSPTPSPSVSRVSDGSSGKISALSPRCPMSWVLESAFSSPIVYLCVIRELVGVVSDTIAV